MSVFVGAELGCERSEAALAYVQPRTQEDGSFANCRPLLQRVPAQRDAEADPQRTQVWQPMRFAHRAVMDRHRTALYSSSYAPSES